MQNQTQDQLLIKHIANQQQISQIMNFTTIICAFPTHHIAPALGLNYCNFRQLGLHYFYTYAPDSWKFEDYLPNQNMEKQAAVTFKVEAEEEKDDSQHDQLPKTLPRKNLSTNQHVSNVIIKYAKKNAQSNVINQIFSFMSIRSKCSKIVTILLENDENLVNLYFDLMRQLKKRNKKYINRNYLRLLIELKEDHIMYHISKRLDPKGLLEINKLRKMIRILTFYYLKSQCVNTILTSLKLDKETKSEHIKRRTQIENYLNFHIGHGSHSQN